MRLKPIAARSDVGSFLTFAGSVARAFRVPVSPTRPAGGSQLYRVARGFHRSVSFGRRPSRGHRVAHLAARPTPLRVAQAKGSHRTSGESEPAQGAFAASPTGVRRTTLVCGSRPLPGTPRLHANQLVERLTPPPGHRAAALHRGHSRPLGVLP